MAALLSNGLSVRRPPSSSAVFRLRRCGLLLGSAASLVRKEGPESEKVIDLSRKSGVCLRSSCRLGFDFCLPCDCSRGCLLCLLFQRLPPLSTEPDRSEKAFVGNTIGQANGVYDKPIDLRFCDYTNENSNLKGKSLTATLMSDAKFDGADMSEVVMSKAYAVGASFKGSDIIQLWAVPSPCPPIPVFFKDGERKMQQKSNHQIDFLYPLRCCSSSSPSQPHHRPMSPPSQRVLSKMQATTSI